MSYIIKKMQYSNTDLDVDYHGNGRSFEVLGSTLEDTNLSYMLYVWKHIPTFNHLTFFKLEWMILDMVFLKGKLLFITSWGLFSYLCHQLLSCYDDIELNK